MNNRELFSARQIFYSPNAGLKIKKTTFADGNSTTTVTGYPIVWNVISSDRGGYKVRLAKGSAGFTDQVMALWHHNFAQPLGGTVNETLRILSADDVGVPVEIDLDMNTTAGSDAYAYISSKLVGGMSFSMANGFEDYSEDDEEYQGETTRIVTVKKFTSDEVTVTPIPAFDATSIAPKEPIAPLPDGTPPPLGGMSDEEPVDRIVAAMKLRSMQLAALRNN